MSPDTCGHNHVYSKLKSRGVSQPFCIIKCILQFFFNLIIIFLFGDILTLTLKKTIYNQNVPGKYKVIPPHQGYLCLKNTWQIENILFEAMCICKIHQFIVNSNLFIALLEIGSYKREQKYRPHACRLDFVQSVIVQINVKYTSSLNNRNNLIWDQAR